MGIGPTGPSPPNTSAIPVPDPALKFDDMEADSGPARRPPMAPPLREARMYVATHDAAVKEAPV